ncbi:phage tail protein [Tenacibaculum larymnensis]|uniref:Tail fiber protein n=1 Tax=Tenacibaculum larymnensis TaxID=2878201 RepID=A0A9X4EP40_9FLAO|nr:tail fiber protein [Tenacibaculum larymnensis]MDE1205560.1 tail fiber protein [Tenacibaculum larymnensis]
MKQSKETLKKYFETGDRPGESQFADLIDTLNTPFIGELKVVSYNKAPQGWAKCDGQLLNITDFQELFNLIGNTYGGDGISTFALPDLRGRVALGEGSNSELSSYLIGQKGGEEKSILTEEELPRHNHSASGTLKASNTDGTTNNPEDNSLAIGKVPLDRTNTVEANSFTTSTANIEMAENDIVVNINERGNGQPFSNIQPYLSVNYIIALEGRIPVF